MRGQGAARRAWTVGLLGAWLVGLWRVARTFAARNTIFADQLWQFTGSDPASEGWWLIESISAQVAWSEDEKRREARTVKFVPWWKYWNRYPEVGLVVFGASSKNKRLYVSYLVLLSGEWRKLEDSSEEVARRAKIARLRPSFRQMWVRMPASEPEPAEPEDGEPVFPPEQRAAGAG